MYLKLLTPHFENASSNAIVLDSTPNILSMGRRVEEGEYSFIWLTGFSPCMILPPSADDYVVLQVSRGLPVLTPDSWLYSHKPELAVATCGVEMEDGDPIIRRSGLMPTMSTEEDGIEVDDFEIPLGSGFTGSAAATGAGGDLSQAHTRVPNGVATGAGSGGGATMASECEDYCCKPCTPSRTIGVNTDRPPPLVDSSDSEDEEPSCPNKDDEYWEDQYESPLREDFRHVSDLRAHQLTHKPARADCDGCNISKSRRKPHFKGKSSRLPDCWGHTYTMDTVYMKDWMGCGSVSGYTDAFTGYDLYSGWKNMDGTDSKDEEQFTYLLKHVKGADRIQNIYCDNWKAFPRACREVGATCEFSSPGIPETNGVIENINGDILQGTRALLFTAGLPGCFREPGTASMRTPRFGSGV